MLHWFLLLLAIGLSAYAKTPFEKAREEHSKALNEYTQRLIDNPKMSKQERETLYQRVLAPAVQAEQKAERDTLREARVEAARELSRSNLIHRKPRSKPSAVPSKKKPKLGHGMPGKNETKNPQPAKRGETAPKRDEVVIDGKHLKREIIFDKSAPSTEPAPGPTVKSAPKSEGPPVIEFGESSPTSASPPGGADAEHQK